MVDFGFLVSFWKRTHKFQRRGEKKRGKEREEERGQRKGGGKKGGKVMKGR